MPQTSFKEGQTKEYFCEIISKSEQHFQRNFLIISLCPYSAGSPPKSPEPCFLRDKYFANSFCSICRRQCHYKFNMVFRKSCIVFCAKPKEVDPIKLISLQQTSVSIALKDIINKCVKINRIRVSMIAILFFVDRYIVLSVQ